MSPSSEQQLAVTRSIPLVTAGSWTTTSFRQEFLQTKYVPMTKFLVVTHIVVRHAYACRCLPRWQFLWRTRRSRHPQMNVAQAPVVEYIRQHQLVQNAALAPRRMTYIATSSIRCTCTCRGVHHDGSSCTLCRANTGNEILGASAFTPVPHLSRLKQFASVLSLWSPSS